MKEGTEFFPDVLQHIETAIHSVRIELYLVESGRNATRFINALCDAAARSVRVELLFDAVGSQHLCAEDRARLERGGVALRIFNKLFPNPGLDDFKRDHRKIIVVDERLAYIGGACITDGFWDPVENRSQWHDLMLRVTGPVVSDIVALFDFRWRRFEGGAVHPEPDCRARFIPDTREGWAKLSYTSGSTHRGLIVDVVRRLEAARERAWLVTPYFLPVKAVFDALRGAASRGVDVQLFLPGAKTDHVSIREAGRGAYGASLELGVTIYELDSKRLHAKATVIDDWVSVGSCNFDVWGANRNLEANIQVYDGECLDQFLQLFATYRTTFRQVTAPDWQSRSTIERVEQSALYFAGRTIGSLLVRRPVR
ncbi:phosphatidylserine/phosphatidylglycerophosphate/cardiolipin synthase family protein [Halopseudomonas nanhaiensis]|uniref:phospholipase D-like domain-containing protein n=1 Tax=Halopseudomonas nanhaiensis TaxID=2830842 RepID=UPI001CBDB12D|nr:phosphatidylserine/phosphatidylglycerophosphate/cardiolipin synthase family protein [Halopseudomonas nanhaiensis]UAW96849.1 phosphatidylserine/phosphatidylglycerophosphate/cardiolipin synthase family protein [Halopseudomonas nanhaiensis]